MAEGSKNAFHTFYSGTVQFVYSNAMLLYDSHEDACRFLVDFYQYLYLHLPEYDGSKNLEGWISRLIIERYEQLSIGKNLPDPSVKKKMAARDAELSKAERERIFRMLDVQIRFPKEQTSPSPLTIVLLISAVLLLLLLAVRYVPATISRLQAASSAEEAESGETTDEDNRSEADNPETDELDSIKDELDDLLQQQADANAEEHSDDPGSMDDADSLQQKQQSGTDPASEEPKTPAAPSAPDAPQEPDTPQEPQSPSLSNDNSTGNDLTDLEDLELQLRYGDGLFFSGSD